MSLYVADPSRAKELVLAEPHLQLYEVNEEYWRHWSDIQLIDLSAVLLDGGLETEPSSSQL